MLFFLSFISTLVLTFLIIKYPIAISKPSTRGMHVSSVPTSGGFAILLSFLTLSIILDFNIYFIILFLFISFIGLLDDIYNLGKSVRFISQIILPISLILLTPVEFVDNYIFLYILIIIAMTYLINVFNFMDGIDTIIVNQSIFVLLSIYILSIDSMLITHDIYNAILLILYAILGFAVFNISPAKIFLGNIGSYLIGFVISYIYFNIMISNINYIAPLLILMTIFIVETLFIIIKRFFSKFSLMKNQNISFINAFTEAISYITEAHCTHNYQIMAKKLNSHSKVNIIILLYNILWCLPLAYMSLILPNYSIILAIISFLPYIYWCYYNTNETNE